MISPVSGLKAAVWGLASASGSAESESGEGEREGEGVVALASASLSVIGEGARLDEVEEDSARG